MTKATLSDIKKLTEAINTSRDKEIYQQLEKNSAYRIGVGARAESPGTLFFFLETLITLSTENGAVNLSRLEKILHFLKTLHSRGYILSYLNGTDSISCEILLSHQKLFKEYIVVKSLVKTYLE
jgi:hypothetical protein